MGDVTAHIARAGDEPLPIGRPLDNTTLELLDDTGAPVKAGERADMHAYFTPYLEACVPEGLCFEASDGQGRQVGCVVASDLFRVHAQAEEGHAEVPVPRALDAVLGACLDSWSHAPAHLGPKEWLYVLLLAATGQREVARLTRELETAVIDAARARGCREVVTINSHALTQQVCEELGYRTEARLDVREFLHEGTRPFADVPEDGAWLRLDVLRL